MFGHKDVLKVGEDNSLGIYPRVSSRNLNKNDDTKNQWLKSKTCALTTPIKRYLKEDALRNFKELIN